MNPDSSSKVIRSADADMDATIRVDVRATLASGTEQTADRIGRYKLIAPLGEGGFGTVWRAEQHEPIHREVALKVIKPGMDSREIVARFEAERQALALMDHPNIAAVLDAGTTESGRPFFAMELVKGVPITDYCDAHKFGIRQRLELFIPVCQAVQHAHQKAVLHRDLKPSNILVMEVDGRPVPKVIDFGIAKALHATAEPALHATLAQTIAGMIVGTPQYMSPEQAGSMPDVDTRSDIYTLGVILYELLVGDTPLSREQMKKAAFDEVLRQVRESEPRRPSSKFTPATEVTKTTASLRHSEPKKLGQALRGDLDWIILKALEKDRSRRYDSANAFSQDLQRHLNDEPVSAGPPSAGYRLRKLVRRNRLAFGAAAAMLVLLVAGIAVSTWQAVRATRAEATTSEEKTKAQAAQKETENRNIALKALVEEAARTDRLMAQDLLNASHGPEALAHLARAGEYIPDTSFAAEKAVVALNDWRFPLPLAVLPGHLGAVKSVQFSPDGGRVITDEDGAVRIWDSATGRLLTTIKSNGQWLCASQFSPDGQKIVTASLDERMVIQTSILSDIARLTKDDAMVLIAALDNMVQVWDSNTGQRLTSLAGNQSENERSGKEGMSVALVTGQFGHNTKITGVEFSPDGQRIVTSTEYGRARVWEAGTGKLLVTLEAGAKNAGFSADGERIVAASHPTRIWDSHSGKLLTTFNRNGQVDTNAQFDLNGTHVLTTAYEEATAHVWDSGSGKLLHTLQTPNLRRIGPLLSAQFSPDGFRIVTVADDKLAWIWEAQSGALVTSLQGHGDQITTAAYSPDSKQIVTASNDITARIWDAATGRLLSTLQGHAGKVISAQFSPDGQRIVTASADKTARIWPAHTASLQATLTSAGIVGAARPSPDGRCVVTVSHSDAQVWESGSGRLLTTLVGHEGPIMSARFSPDNQRIVTASEDGTARLWECATEKLVDGKQAQEADEFLAAAQHAKSLVTLTGHSGTVWGAAFSPDSKRIVTTYADGTARVWESASGKLMATFEGEKISIRNAEFSSDGRRIISAPDSGSIAWVWDALDGKLIASLRGHVRAITSAEFSGDGLRVITASQDKTARVWESVSGKLLLTLQGHEQEVTGAHFSDDGLRIVTASSDMTARVWESASGRHLVTLRGHENKITGAQFSDDGQRILTASADKTARMWDASTGMMVAILEGHAAAVASAQFTPDGRNVITEGDGTPRVWELTGTTVPPAWFADFLRLMAQRRFDDNGELILMPDAEFVAFRTKLEAIVATEHSRHAAIARWFLSPVGKQEKPGKE